MNIQVKPEIAVRAIISHSNPHLYEAVKMIGPQFTVPQARSFLKKDFHEAFDEHMMLTGEVEHVLILAVVMGLKLGNNHEIVIRNGERNFVIMKIEYEHFVKENKLSAKFFLLPSN